MTPQSESAPQAIGAVRQSVPWRAAFPGAASPLFTRRTSGIIKRKPMTENTKPLIGGYNTNGGTRTAPPAAARFNGGAQHRAEIEHAAEARREQSRKLGEAGARFAAKPTGSRDRL